MIVKINSDKYRYINLDILEGFQIENEIDRRNPTRFIFKFIEYFNNISRDGVVKKMVNTSYYTIPIKCYKYLIDGSFIKQLKDKFEEALKK